MSKNNRILMLATDGVEQVELLGTHDVLIREGFDVDIAYGTENDYITTTFNIKIKAELKVKDILNRLDDYICLVLPGGTGFTKLDQLPEINSIIKHFVDSRKLVSAICAAPTLLAKRGYLKDRKAICYDDKDLRNVMTTNGAIIENPVCRNGMDCEIVQDGLFITGLNMKSSLLFGHSISKFLKMIK